MGGMQERRGQKMIANTPWGEGPGVPHFERCFLVLFQQQLTEPLNCLASLLLMYSDQL
jgi:hypothetical protein